MSWNYVGSQECEFNIKDLACYNNHYYILSTDYINTNPGSSFGYRFYEVLDLASMSRIAIGGPWQMERYPNSSMWVEGNFRGNRHLIVYKDKIYFALRDETAPPVIYTIRIFCFDPNRSGPGIVDEVFSSSVRAVDEYYDAWPNDVCIHNDKLFFSGCEQLIRFDGVTWSAHKPYDLPLMNRRDNDGYCDYVSLCSHQGALYLSAEVSGLGAYQEGYTEFKIMVSYDDGDSFSDVSAWSYYTYSIFGGDAACGLVSFNGSIYATIDSDYSFSGGLYKLEGGTSAPSLLAGGRHSFLFTTRYDYETKLYVGSKNQILSIDVNDNITTELTYKPRHPTYFKSAACDNTVTDTLCYVGGNDSWVVSVHTIRACAIYYTESYEKLFPGFSGISIVIIGETLDPIDPIDSDPDNPTYFYGLLGHLSFSLHEVSVSVVWGDSTTYTPAPLKQKLQYRAVRYSCDSVNALDLKHCTLVSHRADASITDEYTHHVPMLHFNMSLHSISIRLGTRLGGPSCKAIWDFESGALTIDSKGHNDLINNYYVSESTTEGGFVRGGCAAQFDPVLSQSFEIADADLGVGFPLKSGDINKLITVCFWMKPVYNSNTTRVFSKFNDTLSKCSFAIGKSYKHVRVSWGTGASSETYDTALNMVADHWYHVGVVADGVNRSLHVRIWDATISTAYDYTYTPGSELYVGDGLLCIGTQEDYDYYAYEGIIDEVVVFNSLLSSGDIDAIRTLGITEFGDEQTFMVVGIDTPVSFSLVQSDVYIIYGVAIKETLSLKSACNLIAVSTTAVMEVEALSLVSTQFEVLVSTGVTIEDFFDLTIAIDEVEIFTSSIMEMEALSLISVIKSIGIVTSAVMEVAAFNLTFVTYEVRVLVIVHAPLVSLASTLHTATAIVVYNNNVYTDPCCKALWRFERNRMLVDTISTNTLTMVGTPVIDIADFKEGGSCIDFEYTGSTQYLTIDDANLSTGFPLKNGDTSKKFTWCFWMKQESQAVNPTYLVSKFHNTSKRSFAIMTYTNKLQAYWGYNNGASNEVVSSNLSIVNGEWYHVGVVVDGIAKTFYIRVFRASNSVITTYSHTQTNELSVKDAAFRIANRDGDTTYRYDGKLDEVVIFNSKLSSTSIDAIRGFAFHAALYTAPLLDLNSTVVAYDVTVRCGCVAPLSMIHSSASLDSISISCSSIMEVELLTLTSSVNEVGVSIGALVSETISMAVTPNAVEILYAYTEIVDVIHALVSLNNVDYVNDFATNPNCIGLWNFETDLSATLGTVSFSNVAGVVVSAEVPYVGVHGSAYFDSAANQSLEVADSSLPDDFPLKSTNEDQLFSVCFWAYIVETSLKPLVAKTNSTGGGLGVVASSTNIMILWGDTLIDTGIPTIVGGWGHYAIVADVKNKRLAVHVYEISTNKKNVIETKAVANISLPSVKLKVGNFSNDPPVNAFKGWISELVMFKELLSTTSIDKIRNGTYKFPTNETNTTNMSTLIGDPSLEFTVYGVTVHEVFNMSTEVDLQSLAWTLGEVEVNISSIVELLLLDIQSTVKEVSVIFPATGIATLVSILLSPKSVKVISPTDISTLVGKSIGIGMELDL